jgi:hypothetical protein
MRRVPDYITDGPLSLRSRRVSSRTEDSVGMSLLPTSKLAFGTVRLTSKTNVIQVKSSLKNYKEQESYLSLKAHPLASVKH